jgi:hypothetical protein
MWAFRKLREGWVDRHGTFRKPRLPTSGTVSGWPAIQAGTFFHPRSTRCKLSQAAWAYWSRQAGKAILLSGHLLERIMPFVAIKYRHSGSDSVSKADLLGAIDSKSTDPQAVI